MERRPFRQSITQLSQLPNYPIDMRVIAGSLERPPAEGARLGRAAADVGQAARDAVQHPRAADCGRAGDGRLRGHRRRRHRSVEPRRARGDRSSSTIARAQALIAENLAHCGVATGYTIIRTGALRALESFATRPTRSDIILLDPPYEASDAEVADVLAAAGKRLAAGGVAVLEQARRRKRAPETAGRLARSRDVVSGSSALTFYEITQ